jgi:hypothetical protein
MRYVVHNYFPKRAIDSYREFPEAWAQAKSIDPLRYLRGLTKLTFIADVDQWNAAYIPEDDEIEIQNKFHKKTFNDKIQTLLHEGGHRGQMRVDKKTFEAMKSAGLINVPNFLAMANQVHQDDYHKNGIGSRELGDEVYAESYARFALGMGLPEGLKKFWSERVSR